jgi:hypothetical protein
MRVTFRYTYFEHLIVIYLINFLFYLIDKNRKKEITQIKKLIEIILK